MQRLEGIAVTHPNNHPNSPIVVFDLSRRSMWLQAQARVRRCSTARIAFWFIVAVIPSKGRMQFVLAWFENTKMDTAPFPEPESKKM